MLPSTQQGGSRAAKRRAAKRARVEPPVEATEDVRLAQQPRIEDVPAWPGDGRQRLVDPEPVAAVPCDEVGSASSYREWQMPLPSVDDDLFEPLQIATAEAATIKGRKYRYGALLLAGEDCIPLKSGSNKKPFMRDNIHAEMSVLKGCARPAGKDMMIARLAPTATARSSSGAGGRGEDTEDSDSDEEGAGVRACNGRHGSTGEARSAPPAAVTTANPHEFGKLLNARPCARCEGKMVARGIRRCYFTINARSIGVLEYNP